MGGLNNITILDKFPFVVDKNIKNIIKLKPLSTGLGRRRYCSK
jgi:hypothetical protein